MTADAFIHCRVTSEVKALVRTVAEVRLTQRRFKSGAGFALSQGCESVSADRLEGASSSEIAAGPCETVTLAPA